MARRNETDDAERPAEEGPADDAERPAEEGPADVGERPAEEGPADVGVTYEIRTANPEFKGKRCGVMFIDGVGATDDAQAAADCAALGYSVTRKTE